MQRPKDLLSTAFLIGANLLPLGGVLLLGWDVGSIVLLYWAENLVVGFYNVLRIALAHAPRPIEHLGKLFLIPFFCVHYGGFCAVHGFFVLLLLGRGDGAEVMPSGGSWPGPLVFVQLLVGIVARVLHSASPEMLWALGALFVSHGVSFAQHYVAGKEYLKVSAGNLMGRPYVRIVVMHLAILGSGFFVMILGSPAPLLLVLIGLKTSIDLWLHLRSHRAREAGQARPEELPEPP